MSTYSGKAGPQKNGITIISANDILWRFCGAYAVAYIGMSTVFTLSFLFSSLVENALGPLVATMSVIIIFFGLSIVDIDFLRQIRPYLFTSHLNIWTEFFNDPVDYSEVFKFSAILLGHTVVFLGASLYIFNKKDILS